MDSEKDFIPNSPEAIAGAWDHLCHSYSDDLARASKRKGLAAIELAAIRLELGNRKGLRILDAGCGPGWHGIELALDGHQLVMSDLSPEMLEKTRAAAAAVNVQKPVVIRQEDIRNLPLETASLDAVVSCGTVVSDCGDADAALSEFSRLLKVNGLAMFSVRNLWDSLDSQTSNTDFDEMKHWIESGRRLIRQGHQAFDWLLFTAQGLRAACLDATMELQRVYPVGVVTPPEDDKDIPPYVQLHIDMPDHGPALARAHELFAVARKFRIEDICRPFQPKNQQIRGKPPGR